MPAWQTSVASISSARIISTGELYDDAAFHKLARTFAACLSRAPYTFSYRCGWLSQGSLLIAHLNAPAHPVGEPALEQLPIWKQCCNEHDRVPQSVSVIRKEENALRVDTAGSQTSIDKYKFSPVPSTRTWVCYIVPNGVVTNDNIRCILHPQQSGTT